MNLTIENLKELATKKTCLEDWGEEDFQSPLNQLLKCFEGSYGNETDKKYSFGLTIVDSLTKRLYIRDNLKTWPETLGIAIKKPLFITGLPRTGTTLMHNLISQSSMWRVLLYWELLYPYQQPNIPNFEQYAINLAEKGLQALYLMKPEFIYRHETKATGPEECFNILRLSYYSIAWANEWYLTEYLRWFLQQDMTAGYRYYKKILQLLLRRRGGEYLLLKCPAHLFTLDALFNVFPDANVIWMHRSPFSCIASGLSLLSVFHRLDREGDEFIDLYLRYFKESLEKAMKFEKSHRRQVKSIGYKALVENPHDVIREAYAWFGYPWDSEKETGITKWLAENPQHKHGKHRYNLEDFGLSRKDIENYFSHYLEEYGHLL